MSKVEDFGIVIYKTYAGSRSYGTNITTEMAEKMAKENGGVPDDYISDTDIRGIFVPYPKYMFGTEKIEQFNDPNDEDTVYFSLNKFLRLALEGNPNVVEQLFVRDEDVIFMHPLGKELRENRQWFISKNAYGRFGSYAWSQLKKMTVQNEEFKRNEKRQKIINLTTKNGGAKYDAKNAMHLVRLFEMGIQILSEGTLETFRRNAKELLEVRDGKYTLEEIKTLAEKLNLILENAMKTSTVPNVPDFEKVNKWTIKAFDSLYNQGDENGVFEQKSIVIPVNFEMIDKATLFLVSNPLVRKMNNAEAQGVVIPYKDWFVGLRDFDDFKYEKASIEHIHKFIHQVINCNPRHIDTIFAPEEKFLYKRPISQELIEKLKTLPTLKKAYNKARNYTKGNLSKMEHWEKLKDNHENLRRQTLEAKKLSKEHWEEKLSRLENEKLELGEKFKFEKDKLIKEYQRWKELKQKKGTFPYYPDIPLNTPNENASVMGKFGYDTILASDIYHTLSILIELIKDGDIKNSRSYEDEMYSIKHGKYKDFNEFKNAMGLKLQELEEVKKYSELRTKIPEDMSEWTINFIQKYIDTL